MAELMTNISHQYDVFIVHSSQDTSKANIISKGLHEKGLMTFADTEKGTAFMIGKPVFDNIVHAIKHSKLVLVLITKHAITSSWVTLETLMALEKSRREDVMCVRLVFEGISERDRQTFKRGVLKVLPEIVLDFNKDGWKDDLAMKIKEKTPMPTMLPAGNVAHGLVFNYFIGFLSYMLPAISTTVEQSPYFTCDKFSRKFFLIIPESCQIKPLEGIYGSYSIEKMEQPLEIDVTHGDKRRKCNPTIYRISKDDEFYYFCADCPFIMATMSKIKEMGFADIDVHLQGTRFFMTLKELVEHRTNQECRDTANIILHEESAEPMTPAIEIWKSLQTEFKETAKAVASARDIIRRTGLLERGDKNVTVTVIYCIEGDCSDLYVAEEIIRFLTSNNVKFQKDESQDHTASVKDDDGWKIFVVSETSVKHKHMVNDFSSALSASTSTGLLERGVLPVLAKGTDLNSIPCLFKWTTCLVQEDPSYLDKMWKAMHDERRMEETLPAGSLFEGLAYSYMINYMSYNLTGKTVENRDFRERLLDAVTKYKVHCKLVPKIYVIVPSSCSFPPPGTQFSNEEHLGAVEPIVMGFRKYFLQLYVLTISKPGKWNGQKVCYAREYATPAIALREMTQLPFAGLSVEEMRKQAKQFADFSNEIMQHDIFNREIGDVRNSCSILYFEDDIHGMDGVTTLIEEHVIQCLEEEQYVEAQ